MSNEQNDHLYDDTLPLPADVERAFLELVGDSVNAESWLARHEIDPTPVLERCGKIALVDYFFVKHSEVGPYEFATYPKDHIGPKRRAFALPINEGGKFVDLLLIGDDMSFETVSCRAAWLGRDNIKGQIVRLHAHPLDWLAAGCTGACHIAAINRKALRELFLAEAIVCNEVATAMDAWSWAFEPSWRLDWPGSEPDLSVKFTIDDTPEAIRRYVSFYAEWRANSRVHSALRNAGVI